MRLPTRGSFWTAAPRPFRKTANTASPSSSAPVAALSAPPGSIKSKKRRCRANLGYWLRTSATDAATRRRPRSWSRAGRSRRSGWSGSKSSPPRETWPANASPSGSGPRAKPSPAIACGYTACNTTRSCFRSFPPMRGPGSGAVPLAATYAQPREPLQWQAAAESIAASTNISPALQSRTGPMAFLLTNDDGVDAPGIAALYAGHRTVWPRGRRRTRSASVGLQPSGHDRATLGADRVVARSLCARWLAGRLHARRA